jgi:hypothetical protein
MAFVVLFTISQSIDGGTIVLSDTSNYGDAGFYHKTDMVSRVLYITRGDDLVENTVNFPYTNTVDATIDTYTFSQDVDYVYSIKMILTDTNAITYTYTLQVITTEYTNKKIKQLLSEDGCGCDCNNNCSLVMKIECGLEAAASRTCAADISGAQQILFQINELADNHINCC